MKVKQLGMLVVMVMVVFLFVGKSFCDDEKVLSIAEDLTISTFYDVGSDSLLVGGILGVVSYKDLISLDVGILTEMSSISYMFGLGINIKTLAEKLKLNFDLNEKVKIGGYWARDFKRKLNRYGIYIGIMLQI